MNKEVRDEFLYFFKEEEPNQMNVNQYKENEH